MSAPLLPQILPGVSNHDPVPLTTAQQIIAQRLPQYATPEVRQAVDSYLQEIVEQQGALGVTASRAVEVAGAFRGAIGGTPEEQARAQLIERGLAADFNKFPKGFRESVAGATDDEVLMVARAMSPNLPPKEALEKYYATVQRTFAPNETYQKGTWYTDPRYSNQQQAPAVQPSNIENALGVIKDALLQQNQK